MNVEQFRLALDAVKDVSWAAQLIALLWVFRTYFYTVVWAAIVVYIVRQIAEKVRRCMELDNLDRLK